MCARERDRYSVYSWHRAIKAVGLERRDNDDGPAEAGPRLYIDNIYMYSMVYTYVTDTHLRHIYPAAPPLSMTMTTVAWRVREG